MRSRRKEDGEEGGGWGVGGRRMGRREEDGEEEGGGWGGGLTQLQMCDNERLTESGNARMYQE